MRITGTFLDEVSWDIPHQNWGREEWKRDFGAMREFGIDTVVLIRSGLRRFLACRSDVLERRKQCYRAPLDLTELFLDLAGEFGMKFYFGTYDSADCHVPAELENEIAMEAAAEAWQRYGNAPAFAGWYLSKEISRRCRETVGAYAALGKFCKQISGGLPVLISPYIGGIKANGGNPVTLEEHEREWDGIFAEIAGAVDIVAFQDGHCEYDELAAYLEINKRLADRHGIESWTNCESFDRDMPIRFLPIKWEKMLLKLEAARQAGVCKAITFEFSHFLSPNSCYPSAATLNCRYREHFFGTTSASNQLG